MTRLRAGQFRESAIIRNAEPEPLDDRADVTAPREWMVLAGLGLALAVLVVWGVFGSVERTVRSDGVLVLSGASEARTAAPEGRRLDAVAFVSPKGSWQLAMGMTARVTVESRAGIRVLPASLAAIAPRAASPPAWLTRMQPDAPLPGRGHLLRIAISNPPGDGALPASLDDGTPCRIEIVLERTSPFRLVIRT